MRALSVAVWGDIKMVDDLHSCRPDEPASSTDDHPLWREFKEAETALNAADEECEGPLPDTHPAWPRWQAARDAIVNARPIDLPGLAVQLRLFNDVFIHSDPSEDERRMMAHVTKQMAVLAAPAGTA